VAIKLMRPEGSAVPSAGEGRARLLREAQTMAKLSHPNVIAVHDVGTAGEDVFIAMEHVEGSTLRHWLSERKRTWREIVGIFVQAGRGLSAAHAAGILHRDFKLDNVLVGNDGRVRVMDFGLARPIHALDSPRGILVEAEATAAPSKAIGPTYAPVTETGRFIGTPGYMAPEQLAGEPASEKTDQFSFCVAFYRALYGELPFAADSAEQLLEKVKQGRIDTPAAATPVPGWLRQIVLRGLKFDPRERYASIDALLEALARPPRTARWSVAAAAILALLATAFGAGLLAMRQRATRAPRIQSVAVLPFRNESGNPAQDSVANQITEALIADVAMLSNVTVTSRTSSMRYKNTARSLPAIGKELGVDTLIMGSVSSIASTVQLKVQLINSSTGRVVWTRQYDRDNSQMVILRADLARDLVGAIDTVVTAEQQERLASLRSIRPEAYEAYAKAQLFLATTNATSLYKAVEYFQQALKEDPLFAPAYAGLANAYVSLAWPASVLTPRESARLAREAANKALEIDPGLGEAHATLGWVKYLYDWDWAGAEKELSLAIKLNPNDARAHRWYGTYLILVRRMDEALVEMKRGQRLDPLSVINQQGIADWYFFNDRIDEAIREYQKAVELNPGHGPVHAHLANVLHKAGRHEEALAENQKAFEISKSPWHEIGIADDLAHLGRREEAEAIIERRKDQVKDSNPIVSVARVYAVLGRNEEALRCLQLGYEAHSFGMPHLMRQPDFNSLHSDPRFQEIVRRVGPP
jgi:TolB-like protein/Flp pilus assembly protein TadD